jgi:Winged helix DNA-binding domain
VRLALNIAQQRLRTQRLSGAGFDTPADAVKWLGAVQAQDYAGALWAVGLRTAGAAEADVEQALADRTIVRTWPLRGTLHFVASADVRWMLASFAPRMIERAAPRFRQLALDARTFARSAALFVKALQGGHQLSRPRMYALLERAGIATANSRGLHILWRCAHDGLLCFGTREGKQRRFALLDEWVPAAKTLDRDEALAELARRYFGWWSGVAAVDARSALDMAGSPLQRTTIAGETYWHAGTVMKTRPPHALLLPPYDEYTVAYQDRGAAFDPKHAADARNGIFSPTILLNGRIAGTWSRAETKDEVKVAMRLVARLEAPEARALADAVARYRAFKRPASAAPPRGSRSTR